MSSPARAFIGLGSNLQDPERQLRAAIAALSGIPHTKVKRHSQLYRTPPWGRADQPAFVNAVAEVETCLSASALLGAMQRIEADAGRARVEKWGPRILDLDLLLHGDEIILDGQLQVPHPHLHERAFVLVPLAELDADLLVPGISRRIGDLLATVDRSGIEALG